MNTFSARGHIRAFFRAKWLELLFAIPAGIGMSMVYRALAVLFMPSDYKAAQAFQHAIFSASSDIGWVAFFGVVAFVILRWRARNASR